MVETLVKLKKEESIMKEVKEQRKSSKGAKSYIGNKTDILKKGFNKYRIDRKLTNISTRQE